jgi:hypothetical protein
MRLGLAKGVTVQIPPSPARRWVSLRSTHPTQEQRVVGWVEERNPSIRGESDGGSERLPKGKLALVDIIYFV